MDMGLTKEEKGILLDIVKTTIQCELDGKMDATSHVESEALREKKGAFVTLRKNEHLRGCIGCIDARRPLNEMIEEMSVAAAFQDPRFPALTHDELKDITVEISVLTPLKIVKHIDEIDVGLHGLYIVKDYHSGLLLPQVATEYQWDRSTFLEETCCKAGLPPQAWKEKDTQIYTFSAEVFSEHW
jgi:AmmeMemoRadiSam system protein A